MNNVLYIDDLLENNYAYVMALNNSKKYNLLIAETPEEAIKQLLISKPPKYIILDIDMPIPENIKKPLRASWKYLGSPDNSYGLVIAAWIKINKKDINIIILSSVPSRLDDIKGKLGNLTVLDRLHCTPYDLIKELDKIVQTKR